MAPRGCGDPQGHPPPRGGGEAEIKMRNGCVASGRVKSDGWTSYSVVLRAPRLNPPSPSTVRLLRGKFKRGASSRRSLTLGAGDHVKRGSRRPYSGFSSSSALIRARSFLTSPTSAACLRSAPRSARTFLHATARFSSQRSRSGSIEKGCPSPAVRKLSLRRAREVRRPRQPRRFSRPPRNPPPRG